MPVATSLCAPTLHESLNPQVVHVGSYPLFLEPLELQSLFL